MQKQQCPKLQHPDIRGKQNFNRSMVPLRLHGDGCCITGRGRVWNKTADIFSWSSCMGKGKTKDLMYFIWCLYQVQRCTLDGHRTLVIFSSKMRWSFQALWRGKHPETDSNRKRYTAGTLEHTLAGTDLAGGFCGCLWILQNDLDFGSDYYGMPRPNAANPCKDCNCGQPGSANPMHDYRTKPPADWMLNMRSVAQHLLEDHFPHELFTAPAVSALSYSYDMMHCKYLGSDGYLYGSVLHLMITDFLTTSEFCYRLERIFFFEMLVLCMK